MTARMKLLLILPGEVNTRPEDLLVPRTSPQHTLHNSRFNSLRKPDTRHLTAKTLQVTRHESKHESKRHRWTTRHRWQTLKTGNISTNTSNSTSVANHDHHHHHHHHHHRHHSIMVTATIIIIIITITIITIISTSFSKIMNTVVMRIKEATSSRAASPSLLSSWSSGSDHQHDHHFHNQHCRQRYQKLSCYLHSNTRFFPNSVS